MKLSIATARQPGFTLIELMIVVAVIAILAAIAYPSYTQFVFRAKRGEARAALTRTMQAEERFFSANNTYLELPSALPTPNGFSLFSSDNPSGAAYGITAAACAAQTLAQCVIVTATAITPDPECGTMTLNSAGNMTSNPSPIAVCWR